jgi:hypothetical protein
MILHGTTAVSTRTKVHFGISGVFLACWAFFITDKGQDILRGKITPDMDHWRVDDIYIGAGLAPWGWMFLPGMFFLILALILLWLDLKSSKSE